MKIPARRIVLCGVVGVGLIVGVLLATMSNPPVIATSSTGSVTVQIVAPGGLLIDSDEGPISPGTLSASMLLLPDSSSDDGASFSGMFVVEDHRSQDCQWTVRLQNDSPDPSHLVGVEVGGVDPGPPPWAYEGVHAWDAAAGLSMANAPPLASATKQGKGGCGLIVNRVELQTDSSSPHEAQTLTVLLPAAP